MVEHDAAHRLAAARLIPPGETEVGMVLDLLFASSGLEVELAELADNLEVFSGVTVPVAQVGHLVALKLLSEDARRLQDRMDLLALCAELTDADRQLAQRAVTTIQQRGYNRERDLETALAVLLDR